VTTTDLRLGDCLAADGMASLPDKSIDVVITDPPYSAHVHAKARSGAMNRAAKGLVRRNGDAISVPVDLGFESIDGATMEACADQFARIARRWVLVFCDIESAHLWCGALVSTGGLEYIRTCAWHKVGGAPQFTGDRPAVWGEAIVVCHPKGRKRWNGGGKQGIYSIPTAIDRDRSGLDARIHTTQKPLRLMEALVYDFTNEGETILDPFAGSGTTLLAARRLGRSAIGWERDAEIYEHARRGLAGEGRAEPDERQVPLFGGVGA
jgi:hypothetical protein